MQDNWIILAEKTVQVSEDSWRRQTKQATIGPESTLNDIIYWAKQFEVDMDSIRLLPLSEPPKPSQP